MGVTPAEATNNKCGRAGPALTQTIVRTIIEDNEVGEEKELEKIQETTRREELTTETQALKPKTINRG